MSDEESRASNVRRSVGATGSPSPTDAQTAAICPFMRTLLVNHPERYNDTDRTMSLEQLVGFVREQRAPEGGGSMEKVFAFFATTNHRPFMLWLKNLLGRADLFSTDFPGSRGDHPGSSGIYRESDGTFDPTAFERVVAHSGDGTTMTQKNVAAAIIESNGREANPGTSLDLAKSAGEFALLFNLIGKPDGTMLISDMRMLFEDTAWPPGALENLGRATAQQWRALTGEITRTIVELQVHGDEHDQKLAQAMHDWVLGSVASVDVAADDHVWIYHRAP